MNTEDWWKEDKPEFIHDCDNCKFLGLYPKTPKIVHDLYICIHNDHGSIIRRFGNEGSEYWSMSLDSCVRIANDGEHDFLSTAIRRAIREGHITANMALELLKSI
jgi:hypothetical protein